MSSSDVERLRPLLSVIERRNGGFRKAHLAALAGKLAVCREVSATAVPADIVTMNSLVAVQNLDSGEVYEFRLVFPGGYDAYGAYVSVFSQLGAALIGSRLGGVVTLKSPKLQRLKVQEIRFQPEASGRFDL